MANKESFFISLGGMTQALKAEKLLAEKGIECTVSKRSEPSGCVWGVYVKGEARVSVVSLLRANGIGGI